MSINKFHKFNEGLDGMNLYNEFKNKFDLFESDVKNLLFKSLKEEIELIQTIIDIIEKYNDDSGIDLVLKDPCPLEINYDDYQVTINNEFVENLISNIWNDRATRHANSKIDNSIIIKLYFYETEDHKQLVINEIKSRIGILPKSYNGKIIEYSI